MKGKVYIVGAGPGAADLLTLRGASILRVAEVVLHDDLVSQEVLELAPNGAHVVNVGKRCGHRGIGQEQVNALMVEHAQSGKRVVRLKSGDPAVFGRLGEELDALRKADVPFEIVPGITAAAAAAASANVTLTDRRAASALVLLTAYNARQAPLSESSVDAAHTTFAVYMPGPDYSRTAKELIKLGVNASAPCVLVSHAGRATGKVHTTSLNGLGSIAGVAAPAVLLVGEAVRAADTPRPVQSVSLVEHSSSARRQIF
jgi:uroporphyrin-III C-methyltransferase